MKNNIIKQQPYVIWLTGLSGSGKSTLAKLLEQHLKDIGIQPYVLDGDVIRKGLNKDLGFSKKDRKENIRRIGEVVKILTDAGSIVISAFITPFESDREQLKKKIGKDRFFEVFLDCPIDICEERDVKGLYKKARKGELTEFTGIDSPYEKPESPNLVIETGTETETESLKKLIQLVKSISLTK